MRKNADYIIIGAGIVGAAVALRLIETKPQCRVIVVEKETAPALHQTGRNSGVIHAGVYYQPNSLKAQFCVDGNQRTLSFCQQYNIAYEQCGKLLVATKVAELASMEALFERCKQHGLSPQMLNEQQIKSLEPNICSIGGFKVTQSGITDYAEVCRKMLSVAKDSGRCEVYYGYTVKDLTENADSVSLQLLSLTGEYHTMQSSKLINCAGIYADEIMEKQGLSSDIRLIPFRGEYYRLSKKFDGLTQHLIYPIPDPKMPFLGVHLTKMIGGFTTVGPNAVLATGKQAYDGLSFSPQEWRRLFGFGGTWRLLSKFKQHVLAEAKTSISKKAYLSLVKAYCPRVEIDDLLPFRAGIRAQAVMNNGDLLHDFVFEQTQFCLHVINAPSPAATSALPIADAIIKRLSN